MGHKAVYLDSKTGERLGDWVPWRGTAADLFVQAQFPLPSGRILNLPGRILISVIGVVIAMKVGLEIDGVIYSGIDRATIDVKAPYGTVTFDGE